MKISVIGGAGFIGTNFCQRLIDHNISFEIIDLKRSRAFPDTSKVADIRNIDQLRDTITGNIVVNLAAVHRDDVQDTSDYYKTNVDGCRNISKVCIEKGIQKIVFTSSVAVYGFAAPDTDESGEINPFNDYGISKFQGEEEFRAWQARDPENRTLTIIRPTVVFGEGNRGNVYNLLRQVASGKFLMIGDGLNKKSMAYVQNLASFLVYRVQSSEKYEIINYVDGPDLDMNTLVSLVNKKITGRHGVGVRLPYFAGVLIGWGADIISHFTKKPLPISSVRIKKFCSSTSFTSSNEAFDAFVVPYDLSEALHRTIHAEFLMPDPDRPIFYTE